jgi:hypothetical protein
MDRTVAGVFPGSRLFRTAGEASSSVVRLLTPLNQEIIEKLSKISRQIFAH